MNDVLRYIVLAGVFVLPFTVLIVANGMFFPFITGKNFFFRIIVEIVFAAWLLLAFRDPRYRPRLSGILIALAAFVGIVGIANVLGENPFKSLWSNLERMEGYLTLVHAFFYFLIVATTLRTERLWAWFAHTSVAASIIVVLYGLVQLAGKAEIHQGGVRVDASLGNAAYLAAYMLFHVFITAVLLLRWRGVTFVSWLYGSIIALQIFILVSTATRGAVLGLIGGLLLSTLLIALFERERRSVRYGAMAIIVSIVLALGGFFAIKDTDFVRNDPILGRFTDISLEAGSTRFAIWNMAVEGAKERPILGWGQENFNVIFNKYYDATLYRQEPWFDHVHNIVLDWLVAAGALGALAYLSIPLVTLWYLWCSQGRILFSVAERSVITGLLAGYFFQNLFVFDTVITYMLYFSVLGYVYARTQAHADTPSFFPLPLSAGMFRVSAAGVVVVLVFSLYFFNGRAVATASSLLGALRATANDPSTILSSFERAAKHEVVGAQEVAEQSAFAAMQLSATNAEEETKMRMFNFAKEQMQEELARSPEDARLRLFYASLLGRMGQTGEAFEEIKKAQKLSPAKPVIAIEVGNLYLAQGKHKEALAEYKKVLDALPNYDEARSYYIAGAIYAQEAELVRALLAAWPGGDEKLVTDDRILNAYAATSQFQAVHDIWKARVERAPDDLQTRLSFVASYLQLNDTVSAIAEIRKIIEMEPEFKVQGEALIEEIRAGNAQ